MQQNQNLTICYYSHNITQTTNPNPNPGPIATRIMFAMFQSIIHPFMEAHIMLAMLVKRFDFELAPGFLPYPYPHPTLIPT